MASTAGNILLRDETRDKMAKAYEEEALIFKGLLNQTSTTTRDNKYWSKTSGYLADSNNSSKVAPGSRPFVLEQSWTQSTVYTTKYMRDSPMINLEDETDSEISLFQTNLKDIVESIAYDQDKDIWEVVSEGQSPTNINSVTATAAWDAASGQDPYEDIMEAKQKIREQTKRKLNNGYLLVSAKGEKDLMVWLVSTKGANVTGSVGTEQGSLMTIAGLKVIVSENVTADYAMVAGLKEAAEWKSFAPMKTWIIEEEGIGRKIRASTSGVAVLYKPKYVSLISNTEA